MNSSSICNIVSFVLLFLGGGGEQQRQQQGSQGDGDYYGGGGRNQVKIVPDMNSSFSCTSPVGSMDAAIMVENDEGEVEDYTTLQWQIGLGDTLCYRFVSEEDDHIKGSIQVRYSNVRAVYPISNSYRFRLAKADVDCNCDCPGGANSCNSHTNRCGSDANCVNWYSSDTSSAGCALNFFKLNSALCCAIRIKGLEDEGNLYRAVQLSVPNVVAQFEVTHRDSNYNVVDTRTYNIDLNSGTTVDWEVSLQLSSPGPGATVPAGWYFTRDMNHSLMGNVPLNSLDEWDPAKLGWLKTGSSRQGDRIDSSGMRVRAAFDARVRNCANNDYLTEFSTPFLGPGQLSSALTLPEMFPFVRSTHVWRRHVEVTHKESPLVVLTLQHRSKVDVVMRFDSSELSNFTGSLILDDQSNQFLSLTLLGVKGTIYGTVLGSNSSQAVQISATQGKEVVDELGVRVKVTGIICDAEQKVTLSLRPATFGAFNQKSENSSLVITRDLNCVEQKMRTFKEVDSVLGTGMDNAFQYYEQQRDCLGCPSAWGSFLNPFNWISHSGAQSAAAGTEFAIIGSASAIAVFLICVICCCVKAACCCKCCR